MLDSIPLAEWLRSATLYAHLLISMLAVARVLHADVALITGRIGRAQLQRAVHDIAALLVGLWITGIAIVWLDTGFDPDQLAMRSKLMLKLVVASVLTLNGMVLHRSSFPILLSDERPGRIRSVQLAVTGALSSMHWLLAAFVGVTRPLGQLPVQELLWGYAVLVALTVGMALGCLPLMVRYGILTRFAAGQKMQHMPRDAADVLTEPQFEHRLEFAIAARRCRDRTDRLVVVALDVADAPPANSRCGLAAGTQGPGIPPERLRAGLRSGDLVARTGSGGFVLLLGVEQGADFVATIKRLRDDIVRVPVVTGAVSTRLRLTVGIAVHAPQERAGQVVRRAIQAQTVRRPQAVERFQLAPPPIRLCAPAPRMPSAA